MNPTSNAFNNRCLTHLHNKLYKDVITSEMMAGDELGLEIDNSGQRTPGYIFKKDIKRYFLPTQLLDKLPLRVKETYEIMDGKNVFHVITTDCVTIKMPNKNSITFKQLIDWFCNFEHTMPDHLLIWKIMIITAYVNRITFMLGTPPAFLKNGIVNALKDLTDNCAIVDRATFPKLEYLLKYPLIVCNEIGTLKKNELEDFQGFGLTCGDLSNSYLKRSRKTKGVGEVCDIHELSLGFTFNDRKCYEEAGKKGFEELGFTGAFKHRFFPVKMNGVINLSCLARTGEIDFNLECETNMEIYKKIIEKIGWLRLNVPKNKFAFLNVDFGKEKVRWKQTFDTICLYIGEYAKDKEEYERLCGILLGCHKCYLSEEVPNNIVVEEEVVVND